MKEVFFHQLHDHLKSLRFQVSLLVLLFFFVGNGVIYTWRMERLNKEVAQWEMRAEWQEIASLNMAQAIHLTLGLPIPQAIQQLENNLPLSSPAEITLTPDWWPRLPMLPFRIRVEG